MATQRTRRWLPVPLTTMPQPRTWAWPRPAWNRPQQRAETVANKINEILNDAAEQPAVQISESTNEVIPPDTTYLDEEAAARVAAKVAALQARVSAVVATGELIDGDLAAAIATATGAPQPPTKTTSSLEDLLLPGTNEDSRPATTDKPTHPPGDLDGALEQLAGQPLPEDSPAPVRLDPAQVEKFKSLARQAMQADGVPADQIEPRLDALVAAAQKPLPRYTAPKPESMPPPGFGEGFADRWFDTEQGIKNLLGQGGPGAPGVWESWRDLIVSTNDQLTDPVGTAVDEIKYAIDSPSAAYYLGEKAADGAVAAPGLVFGGEGALLARAGALDGIGPGVPQGLIDGPAHPSTIDPPTTPTPLAGDTPSIGDVPSAHAPAPTPIPLPSDSPLFDGYDPTPPGVQFTNPDGGLIYPDDSLPSKPYAVPGTVIDNAEIPQGTVIDRFGYPGGTWLSPEGVPFAERALPPDSAGKPYYQYVVEDPSKLQPGWRIEQSQAAPWFHQPGGGTQYRIIAPDGDEASTQALINWGFIREAGS